MSYLEFTVLLYLIISYSMDRSSSDTIDRNEHFKKLVTQPIVAKYFLNHFAPFKGAGIQI